jgi:hypothetical protein
MELSKTLTGRLPGSAKYQKPLGTILIALGTILILTVLYHNSQKRQQAYAQRPLGKL